MIHEVPWDSAPPDNSARRQMMDMAIYDALRTLTMMQDGRVPFFDGWERIRQIEDETRSALLPPSFLAGADLQAIQERFIDEMASGAAGRKGITTGLPTLDRHLGGGLKAGMYTIVGETSTGKSVLCLEIADEAARRGAVTLYVSAEMNAEQLAVRSLARRKRLRMDALYKGSFVNERGRDVTADLRADAARYLDTPLLVRDSGMMSTGSIEQLCRHIIANPAYGRLDLLVIDYIHILHDRFGGGEFERISHVARNIQRLSREFNIPVVAGSQINRVGSRAARRITLPDIKSSSSIEQDSDVVLAIQVLNPHEDGKERPERLEVDLEILKNRHGRAGVNVHCFFEGPYQLVGEYQNNMRLTEQEPKGGKDEDEY